MTRGLSSPLPSRNSSRVCQAFKQLAAKTITVSPRPRLEIPFPRHPFHAAIQRWRFLNGATRRDAARGDFARGTRKGTTVPRTFGISSRQIFIVGYYENFLFRLSRECSFQTLADTTSASFIIDRSKIQRKIICAILSLSFPHLFLLFFYIILYFAYNCLINYSWNPCSYRSRFKKNVIMLKEILFAISDVKFLLLFNSVIESLRVSFRFGCTPLQFQPL